MILSILLMATFSVNCYENNNVMLQGFYWDFPVDEVNKYDTWWDNLGQNALVLGGADFSGMQAPAYVENKNNA